jgi:hypothetical protein
MWPQSQRIVCPAVSLVGTITFPQTSQRMVGWLMVNARRDARLSLAILYK